MDTIGFIELSSIAAGVGVTDVMLKAAQINLIFAKASCPGKYFVLVNGQVSGVENAVKDGLNAGGSFVVSSLVLPKIHPQVVAALNMAAMPDKISALGVMEFYSVTSSIVAADTAVKASNVELIDVRLGTGIGGKSFVVLTGETASVSAAVRAAEQGQMDSGMLVHSVVIPKPAKELLASLL